MVALPATESGRVTVFDANSVKAAHPEQDRQRRLRYRMENRTHSWFL
jgi:hypothetical protein